MFLLLKGVNHQVVEITKPTCEYFERVIFFVKPEFSTVSEGTLRERADEIAGKAGSPPPTRLRRDRIAFISRMVGAALAGAAVATLVIKLLF